MKKKIVKSKKRVPKFQDGGIGKLKPRTALEAAKDLKINPTIATAQTLEEQTASAKDASKKGTQKFLGPGQKMLPAPKGSGQLKFNFRKGGKITKMKRGGKKC